MSDDKLIFFKRTDAGSAILIKETGGERCSKCGHRASRTVLIDCIVAGKARMITFLTDEQAQMLATGLAIHLQGKGLNCATGAGHGYH